MYVCSKNCNLFQVRHVLPGGELNPGLPRDRRGYSPLYYRGHNFFINDYKLKNNFVRFDDFFFKFEAKYQNQTEYSLPPSLKGDLSLISNR